MPWEQHARQHSPEHLVARIVVAAALAVDIEHQRNVIGAGRPVEMSLQIERRAQIVNMRHGDVGDIGRTFHRCLDGQRLRQGCGCKKHCDKAGKSPSE